MVVAIAGLPVKLTDISSITKSNSVPCSTGAVPSVVNVADTAEVRPPRLKLAMTPLVAKPYTNCYHGRFGSTRSGA